METGLKKFQAWAATFPSFHSRDKIQAKMYELLAEESKQPKRPANADLLTELELFIGQAPYPEEQDGLTDSAREKLLELADIVAKYRPAPASVMGDILKGLELIKTWAETGCSTTEEVVLWRDVLIVINRNLPPAQNLKLNFSARMKLENEFNKWAAEHSAAKTPINVFAWAQMIGALDAHKASQFLEGLP